MTLRQFKIWMAWLELERDNPEQIAQYVMQLTAEVMRIGASFGCIPKKDMPDTLDDLKLRYKEAPTQTTFFSKKKRRRRDDKVSNLEASMSKLKWHIALGGKITTRNPDGTLTLPDGRVVNEEEYNRGNRTGKTGSKADR